MNVLGVMRNFICLLELVCCSINIAIANDLHVCPYEGKSECIIEIANKDRVGKNFVLTDGSEISINLSFSEKQFPSNIDFWGADELAKGKRVLSSVKITWGGEVVSIPASAFVGMSDINELIIYEMGGGFHLMLKGGDAGTSYFARFNFMNKQLLWKQVTGSGFPGIVWEQTTYSSF